jgi:prophage DNA circulation protein
MGWRDQIRRPSFRGVAFDVDQRATKGGRHLAEHVFPQRDEAYPEDLGLKNRTFSVQAFVMGQDYIQKRDALVAALETKGPGEYVDQWGFSRQVVVKDFTLNESKLSGGYAGFSIEFVTWSLKPIHTVAPDTGHATRTAAERARPVLAAEFARVFDVRGPGLLAADAGQVLEMASARIQAVRGTHPVADAAAERGPGTAPAAAARLSAPAALTAAPAELGALIVLALPAAFVLAGTGWRRYRAARAFMDFGASLPAIAETTPARRRQAANRRALIGLVRGLALVEAALATASIPFAVYDDAVAVRHEVAADLDEAMGVAADPVYQALAALRAAMVRDVTARGADLAHLTRLEPLATLPMLVLAQRLYGDPGRAGELLERNRFIRHPGFVPGGAALEAADA